LITAAYAAATYAAVINLVMLWVINHVTLQQKMQTLDLAGNEQDNY